MERVEESQASQPFQSIPPPWLICFPVDKYVSKTIFSLIEQKSYNVKMPEIAKKRWLVTSHGWLLIQDRSSRRCFLWNPVTLSVAELPILKLDIYKCCDCCLSTDPADPGCIVLLNNKNDNTFWYCQYGGKWNKHSYDKEEVNLRHMLGFEGKFYGYSLAPHNNNLVTVDFTSSLVLHKLHVKRPSWPPEYAYSTHLIECCGDIFQIRLCFHVAFINAADVAIYKLDFLKQTWCDVESIGDNIFFIDTYIAFSRPAKDLGVKGNCVYFVVDHERRHFYIFDVKQGTLLRRPHSPNSSTDWDKCLWICPKTNESPVIDR